MLKNNNYKIVLQKKNYDCGVAASAALLINSGAKKLVHYKKLAKKLKLSTRGVYSDKIASHFLLKNEIRPKIKVNSTIRDLKTELKKNRLCMIMYQGWAKEHEIDDLVWGHYAIAVKVSKNKVYLLDPGANDKDEKHLGWRVMKLPDFKKRWVEKEKNTVIKGWMLSVKTLKN